MQRSIIRLAFPGGEERPKAPPYRDDAERSDHGRVAAGAARENWRARCRLSPRLGRMRRLLGTLFSATALLAVASPAVAAPTVVRSGASVAPAVAAGEDGLVAIAAPRGGRRLSVVLRTPLGAVRYRTLTTHTARIDRLVAAVDEHGRTVVAWEAFRSGRTGLAYSATLDARGRVLVAPARVPLGPGMHIVAVEAGRGHALLVANVFDTLQRGDYCSLGSRAFAGDNYFGAVTRLGVRFIRPASIGTGDSYGGSGFLSDGRAVSTDFAGDLDARPQGTSSCTLWAPFKLADRQLIRSGAVLDSAGDGTTAWGGQSNEGPYVQSGDEESNPPIPAPAPLHVLVIRGPSGLSVPLGTGASLGVAAIAGGRGGFAWLDQPAPVAFGGPGDKLPSTLRVTLLRQSGRSGTIDSVDGMIADPSAAHPPQVAASSDGTVAVLERAGRYRLAIRHPDGTVPAPTDEGASSSVTSLRVLSAGRRIYLVRQTLGTTRVYRIH